MRISDTKPLTSSRFLDVNIWSRNHPCSSWDVYFLPTDEGRTGHHHFTLNTLLFRYRRLRWPGSTRETSCTEIRKLENKFINGYYGCIDRNSVQKHLWERQLRSIGLLLPRKGEWSGLNTFFLLSAGFCRKISPAFFLLAEPLSIWQTVTGQWRKKQTGYIVAWNAHPFE